MKLSFSSNAFTRYSLVEAVGKIAAIGYGALEILADQPHLFAPTVTAAALHELKTALASHSLAVANINANTVTGYYGRSFWEPLFEPSLANPDPQARQWRIQYTKDCIDLARTLGAANISLTSGRLIPGVKPQESLAILREAMAEVLAHAQENKVRIGIEYEPGLLIENCPELVRFLKEVDSPWLGANLDIGHCQVAHEDIGAVLGALGEKIFHIHLEDIAGHKHFHLIPGEGDLDFDAILASLARQSYDGYVTVELYSYPQRPEEAARQAMTHLTQLPYWQ